MLRRFFRISSFNYFQNNSSLLCSEMECENPVPILDSSKRKIDEVHKIEDENDSKKLKNEAAENTVAEKPEISANSNRVRRPRKVVVLLCYLGKNYFGMQRNNGVKTVEEDLLKAMLNAGIILQDENDSPKNMKFQRAARTDKGVSAVRQIVSLKIPQLEITDAFSGKVNEHLPPEIRVFCAKRVTQTFDAKISCDARTYSYMLPTFAFADSENDGDDAEVYRISAERIEEVNKFLQSYVGTHNFYNFTSGRLPGDKSCNRYIMSVEVGTPFEIADLQFCIIRIKGQSFMLHQIRKMIGLGIAVVRKLATDEVLEKCWKNERIDIPKAPGLGLMLEEVHYDWYNKRYGGDGLHEALQWNDYQETITKFREEQIYANIALTEKNEKSMLQWLQTLCYHTYDIREQKPPEKIPTVEMKPPVENSE